MRRLRGRVEDERGIVLVMALLVLAAMAVAVVTVVEFTSSSGRSANVDFREQQSYNLAEAGIADAMSVLRMQTNNALDPAIFCANGQAQPCWNHQVLEGGTVDWTGTLAGATWTLTSVGTAANPTGPGSTGAAPLTKKITATVLVHPTLTQPLNTPIWNYMYATHPASPLPTCDMTISNSVVVNSPLYVEGNLCLQQSAAITNGPLVVKGRLYLANKKTSGNPGNYVGQQSSPVNEVHILNGCNYNGTLYNTPCPKDGTDNIWASLSDGTVPASLSPPTVDYNKWYLNGSPGPYFPCQTVGGRAPISGYPVFDSPVASITADDTTKLSYRDNNQGNQNLTPGTSYRCETQGGSLIWDATNHVLTISGTIYIDGSLYVSNGAINRYQGQGVIYLTGTFLNQGSGLCGVLNASKTGCNNSPPTGSCSSPSGGWDPNCNLLVIVAGGTGGQVSAGDSIQYSTTSDSQMAVFGAGNVDIGQSSKFAGPIVGNSIILGQSVSTSFPPITSVPNGMPQNPTAYAYADPPVYGG